MPETLFDKLWQAHCVRQGEDGSAHVYIDRVFLHERTGAVALRSILESGRAVRAPGQVFCTIDHIVDTNPGRPAVARVPGGEEFIRSLRECAARTGIRLYDVDDSRQGIVHLVAAEQGIAHPGLTLVCPDSHTGTLGALGMMAWGLGSSDAEHALVTRTLKIARPQTMRLDIRGGLAAGVGAKDVILHCIGRWGADGGAGCAIEYAGGAVRGMAMPGRFTLCNMAVEFGAFCGLVSVDETTLDYVRGRPFVPADLPQEQDFSRWRTDPGATFDRELVLDVEGLAPTLTWGTSPEHACGIDGQVPQPDHCRDAQAARRALQYMDLRPGQRLQGLPIDCAFIGSCTNARLSDLREAASVLRGRRVADGVRAICTPGSTQTRLAAEAEGLDRVFTGAGFAWHEAGCSMCFYAGGETVPPGSRVVSTSNRNFEGRQGPGVRTHLASPVAVAASALAGHIADPREALR